MLLKAVYTRFYKSFNFDYLRKSHPDAQSEEWELTADGLWYPFVRVQVEEDITTVVGANESGKSQLLSAIKCALTGEGIERADFCRYSQFFAIDQAMPLPDFGAEFGSIDDDDRAAVAAACGLDTPPSFDRLVLLRLGDGTNKLYVRGDTGLTGLPLRTISPIEKRLPKAFEIDAEVPLPESVPVTFLATGTLPLDRTRRERRQFWDGLLRNSAWFESQATIAQQAQHIADFFKRSDEADTQLERELRLADDLLVKVAGVHRTAFQELQRAVTDGEEGFANGIVEKINRHLAEALNFPKWWSQDRQFELLVTLRDMDLVFTIRDRTGTEYSFGERSGGLKYFLSYFVQYLAHEVPPPGVQEVLLMDEPDAYLSSQGQQDLLRIFDAFAHPVDERPPCQVVYVTHSPFLIDKNHGERIRVLEKGEGDEGTRVIRDVGRNHYEPLRSAFGAFVGETTFIGNCNLMVEGPSDQILIAGMSAVLRDDRVAKTENLDLNDVTLVPAGSASQIPYMVYLARGRDVERPAVVVLLDGDAAGDDARRELGGGGRRGRRLIEDRYVLQLSDLPASEVKTDNPGGVKGIEDLVPLEVVVAAAKSYVREFLGGEQAGSVEHLSAADAKLDEAVGTHRAVETAFGAVLGETFHLDKVGLARSIIRAASDPLGAVGDTARAVLLSNFRALFRELGKMQRQATKELTTERVSSRINRARHSFLLDHPQRASRADASILFEEIDTVLDSSVHGDELRLAIRKLIETHDLDQEVARDIDDYPAFKDALTSLAYQERRESQEVT